MSPRQQDRPEAFASGPSLPTLLALALAAMAIGFAGFTYAVPYARAVRELKRKSGELLAERADAAAKRSELTAIKRDLAAQSGGDVSAEGTWRTDLKVTAATVQQRLAGVGAKVGIEGRTLRVTFPEDALFDGRGPWFSKQGQSAIDSISQVLAQQAGRILVAAPMGGAKPPRWVADKYPNPGDLAAERVRTTIRALAKANPAQGALWGVTIGASGPENSSPTLVLEVEPKP